MTSGMIFWSFYNWQIQTIKFRNYTMLSTKQEFSWGILARCNYQRRRQHWKTCGMTCGLLCCTLASNPGHVPAKGKEKLAFYRQRKAMLGERHKLEFTSWGATMRNADQEWQRRERVPGYKAAHRPYQHEDHCWPSPCRLRIPKYSWSNSPDRPRSNMVSSHHHSSHT